MFRNNEGFEGFICEDARDLEGGVALLLTRNGLW